MSEHRITYISAPTEVAEQIANALVEEDLAACVNIIEKVRSIYRWEGQVEHATESFLMAKSTTEKTDALIQRVIEIHPYEVPEIVSVDITAGSKDYLDWISGKEIVVDDGLLDEEEIEEEDVEEEEEADTEK